MIHQKNVAELVKVNNRWRLSFFTPANQAWCYDDMEEKTGVLYAIKCEDFCKIGMTTNLEKRFWDISAGTPFDVFLVSKKVVPFAGLAYAEAWLHKQFADRRVKNEWFKVTPEEAADKLHHGKKVAELYTRHCRDWFIEDRDRKRNDPEYQRQMREEYHSYLLRNLESIEAA
jgi:hypothetical protein